MRNLLELIGRRFCIETLQKNLERVKGGWRVSVSWEVFDRKDTNQYACEWKLSSFLGKPMGLARTFKSMEKYVIFVILTARQLDS